MANDHVQVLDDSNFKEAISADGPILVDFWAQWCGPCRMVAPVLEELAEELQGKVRFAKVDVDANQAIAMEYGVQAMPTFILFENGEVKERLMGARPKAAFESFLDKNAGVATA